MPTPDPILRRQDGRGRCLSVILLGACILFAVTWLWLRSAIRTADDERAAANRRELQIEAQLSVLEGQARALRADNLKLSVERRKGHAQETAADEASTKEARKKIAGARGWAKLYYRELFDELGLDNARQARFIALAAEHRLRGDDLRELGASSRTLRKEESADYQTASAEFLGPTGVIALKEYDRTALARSMAAGLASNVYDTDPLTPAQASALIPIFAQASPTYQKGGNVLPTDLDWSAALGQAQSVLTSAQMAALVEQHATDAAITAMWKRARDLGYKD